MVSLQSQSALKGTKLGTIVNPSRPDAAQITGGVGGNSDAACCAKSCALFTCVHQFQPVEGAPAIIGDTADICCRRASEGMAGGEAGESGVASEEHFEEEEPQVSAEHFEE
ncbi:unnamed protein product [Durusdinium trenchii]|uniref:Uncharacterized protein n=1 Tax=Durusdinium trenchii TaxID=1381693 RepID=A0ABP0PJF3_9DINO